MDMVQMLRRPDHDTAEERRARTAHPAGKSLGEIPPRAVSSPRSPGAGPDGAIPAGTSPGSRGNDTVSGLCRGLVRTAEAAATAGDVAGFLDHSAGDLAMLLPGVHVGITLVDRAGASGTNGPPASVATTDAMAAVLEFEAATGHGPGARAAGQGEATLNPDSGELEARWPGTAALARAVGLDTLHAFPLVHHGELLGAVVLGGAGDRGPLNAEEAACVEAMATATAVGISQIRLLQAHRLRADQLQHALDSRVTIEQAKGVLAERLHIPVDTAFHLMRRHARNNGRRLVTVASRVVDGRLGVAELRLAG